MEFPRRKWRRGKSNLLRTLQQVIARQDALNGLKSETVLVINDASANEMLRITVRVVWQKRKEYWHFSAVVHPDCKPTKCEYQIHAYIAVFNSCKQDCFLFLAFLKNF